MASSKIATAKVPLDNFPSIRTSFIGRKREIREVRQRLASSRLVTLTGAAGCGKTRLALRVARDVGDLYAGGAYWIELAPLDDPALVAQTVAKVLRVAEQAEQPAVEALLEALQERQPLLVLDNCEHLLGPCGQLIERLLAETAASVLATSREPLAIVGEKLYPVSPLLLPPASLAADDVDGISRYDAVKLFIERARAIVPAFELEPSNAGAIAEICQDLDGIPLAIELASARVNLLTVEEIAARLEDQIGLLDAAPHATYSHHPTLRAAIDWSYELLTPGERTLLRRMSVFAGGCSLADVKAVCPGDGLVTEQMLDLLGSLVHKSLVVADTLQRSEARYALLEPLRQYAREKLKAAGEERTMRDRHLERVMHVTEETATKLSGEYQQLWLNWLEGEYDNVRAALGWSLDSGQIEEGLRTANALYQFWTIRDYVEEAFVWFERLLTQADAEVAVAVRASALAHSAFLAGFRGNRPARVAYGREAGALVEDLEEDKQALTWALAAQGYGARATGDYQTEFAISQRLIALYRELGDTYRLGLALSLYSVPAMALGKYDAAREMLDEGLPLLREIGDPYRVAMGLNFAGDLARCEGIYDRAQRAYEESLSLLRDIEAVRDRASVLHNLGHTCLHLGDVERAETLFGESLELHQEQRNRPGMAECLIGFAALALARDAPAAGVRLLAASAEIGGQHVTSEWAATRMEYEGCRERARAALSEKQFEAEQAKGRALSLEEAVAQTREMTRKAAVAQTAREQFEELTPREREVATLIAQAMSNGEIAEELVVSKRTVETHISNIRSKLGFTKRAQIVRWAIRSGLVEATD